MDQRNTINLQRVIDQYYDGELPVKSPIVPPIEDKMSLNFEALSLVIMSKVGVSKNILTILKLFFHP